MKIFKLLSPISFVILVIALFMMFGGGCSPQTLDSRLGTQDSGLKTQETEKVTNTIPRLDILEPGLSVMTDKDMVNIVGETDQDVVYVLNNAFPVAEGRFEVQIGVQADEFTVPVSVSNGMTTTTIQIHVMKKK
ncbi:MAG: hypothetical protein ACOYUZ_02050 [Patescibacteria group bacterium]